MSEDNDDVPTYAEDLDTLASYLAEPVLDEDSMRALKTLGSDLAQLPDPPPGGVVRVDTFRVRFGPGEAELLNRLVAACELLACTE